jgi:hypothetical protein
VTSLLRGSRWRTRAEHDGDAIILTYDALSALLERIFERGPVCSTFAVSVVA